MTHEHGHHHEHVGHVVPKYILWGTWAALMVLTVLTVAVTYKDLGSLNLFIAMAIATVKASLVVLFFMHLRWDAPFNAIVFISSLVFVALFIYLALIDTDAYKPNIIPGYAPAMQAPAMPELSPPQTISE